MKQKYFFPLNYTYTGKLLGIIEYKLLLPISILGFLLYIILKYIPMSLFSKIIIFIVLFLPTVLMLNSKVNAEPFYTFAFAIIKHYYRQKKYLYKRVIWCGINLTAILSLTFVVILGPEYLKCVIFRIEIAPPKHLYIFIDCRIPYQIARLQMIFITFTVYVKVYCKV